MAKYPTPDTIKKNADAKRQAGRLRYAARVPARKNTQSLLYLGKDAHGQKIHLELSPRQKHMHVLGQTGKGKTKFLEHCIQQDITTRRGVCVIDPHGNGQNSLYHNTIKWIANSGLSDKRTVHLIEPGNPDFTTCLNPLNASKNADPWVVADNLTTLFERVWKEDFKDKPLIANILPVIFVLLIEYELTLNDVAPIFAAHDPLALRKYLFAKVKNADARLALDRLQGILDTPRGLLDYEQQMMGPLNRLAQFTRIGVVKQMLGLKDHSLDFFKAMEEGHVLLVNLQDRDEVFSTKAADLIGTMIVRELFRHCRRRIPNKSSIPFFLYIDECQRFLTDDIPSILDEARKFNLHAILSHQRLGQLADISDNMLDAVRANTHCQIAFGGMTMKDAKEISEDCVKLDLERPIDILIQKKVVGYEIIELKSNSEATGSSVTDSEGTNEAIASSTAHSLGHGTATSRGEGLGQTTGVTVVPTSPNISADTLVIETTGALFSTMESSSDSIFEAVSKGITETKGQSRSSQISTSHMATTGMSEALKPILEALPGSVYDLEKLRYMAGWSLRHLKAQSLLVSSGGLTTIVDVPDIPDQAEPSIGLEALKQKMFNSSPASLPTDRAKQMLKQHRQKLAGLEIFEPVSSLGSFDINDFSDTTFEIEPDDNNILPFPPNQTSNDNDPDDEP